MLLKFHFIYFIEKILIAIIRYVNGKQLEESQNIKIHAEKGTYTVTIKDNMKSDNLI